MLSDASKLVLISSVHGANNAKVADLIPVWDARGFLPQAGGWTK